MNKTIQRYKREFYFLLLIVTCITIVLFEFYQKTVIKNMKNNLMDDKISKTSYEFDKCEIFFKNKYQFYTEINGEVYPKSVPIYENKSINFECLNSVGLQKQKTILFWNSFNGAPLLNHGVLKNLINKTKMSENILTDFHCPVNSCKLTFDRNKLNQSQMVLFHLRSIIDEYPKFRSPDQHWVIEFNQFFLIFKPCYFRVSFYSF